MTTVLVLKGNRNQNEVKLACAGYLLIRQFYFFCGGDFLTEISSDDSLFPSRVSSALFKEQPVKKFAYHATSENSESKIAQCFINMSR